MQWLRGSVAILMLAAAGCEQLAGRQPEVAPQSASAETVSPVPDLADYVGRSYAEFVDDHETRFNPTALGLAAADRARLWRAMATSRSVMIEGGGAEALVFRGCAETGCAEGVAVVAIDAASGAPFIGVSDAGGHHVLAPNDRLEALLRLNAPTREWIDAGPQVQSADLAPQTAPP